MGLVSLVIENTKDGVSPTIATQMDTASDGHAPSEDGTFHTTSEDSSAESCTSSRLSLDVPFDAHMLPGRGRRLCAVLPVICISDASNIVSLLTSTLYQRYVWNIDEPVVGLVISHTGTAAQVYLAWLESRSDASDQLVSRYF